MAWRDQLRDASFRGVPFFVEVATRPLGRRVELHEYPDRDKGWAEDSGRKTPVFSLRAYVIGPDYMADRDRLEEALNKPGAGTLVHPYKGTLSVVLMGGHAEESTREGGMCAYDLEFAEAGSNITPESSVQTQQVAIVAAEAVKLQGPTSFAGKFSTAGLPQFVSQSATGRIQNALSAVKAVTARVAAARQSLFSLSAKIASITSSITSLIQAPGQLAAGVLDVIASVRDLASTPERALGALETLMGFGGRPDPGAGVSPGLAPGAVDPVPGLAIALPAIPGATAERDQERANQAAVVRLVQRAAAAEAVLVVGDLTFASYEDAVAVRDRLAAELAILVTDAGDEGDDDAWEALQALRQALVRDINARGASLATLFTWTPPVTLPAQVIAYRIYGDALRDQEIVDRNRVAHPGFVPGGVALELLTPEAAGG